MSKILIDESTVKLVLEKIATVNAMDYEYQAWAREALAEHPAQPYKGIADHTNQVTNGRMRIDPVTGDVGIGTPFSQRAQQEPVLQDIEQYRLQMAGISTAAIGYWKEDDGIHPDYDTLALRDVAKLYAKYDELCRAEPAQQEPVAWLRKSDLVELRVCNYMRIGADSPSLWAPNAPDVPSPDMELVAVYTSPPAQRKPLTREQVKAIMAPDYNTATMQERADFMIGFRAAEAAHNIKENT